MRWKDAATEFPSDASAQINFWQSWLLFFALLQQRAESSEEPFRKGEAATTGESTTDMKYELLAPSTLSLEQQRHIN